jgi:hypothetical protein
MVRIAGTRVTLDVVIACYLQGDIAEAIADGFTTLKVAGIHAVIAYYPHHKEEVGRYLEHNDREGDELRRKYEEKYGKQPTLAELEARRS